MASSPQHIGWLLWPKLKYEVRDPPGLPGWVFAESSKRVEAQQ